MTDLERLWAVGDFIISGRRCGKTYYHCHLIAGAVGLKEPDIFVVVPQFRWLNHIRPILNFVLREHGLTLIKTRETQYIAWLSRITFLSAAGDIRRRVCGYHDPCYIFIDTDKWQPGAMNAVIEAII